MSVEEVEEEKEERIEHTLTALEAVGTCVKYESVLREYANSGTFRLKHVSDPEFTRGSLFELIEHEILVEKADTMGRATDWALSDRGRCILDALDSGRIPRITPYQATVIGRNPSVISSGEIESGDEFSARDFGFGSSRMATFHEAELVEVADGTVGEANVWKVRDIVDEIRLDVLEELC